MSEFIPRSERIRREKEQAQGLRRRRERRGGGGGRRSSRRRKGKSPAGDWLKALLIALVLAIVIRVFLFEPTHVSGPSMEETLMSGDKVLVNKLLYTFRDPERGEVVVFHADEERDLIKRVIALPGDTVEAKENAVFVNGKKVEEPYLSSKISTPDFPAVKVPDKHVFVLGDNRLNSTDSRQLGPVSLEKVVGRAEFVYWPLDDFRFLGAD